MWSLKPWAAPALPRIILGGTMAMFASLLALSVPQVLRAVVNGPLLSSGSVRGVVEATVIVLALGTLEAFLIWTRRALIATPGTGIELNLRMDMFRRLLDLPISYHDRTSSGQLLSRIMGDLGSVRRWFSFAIVMIVVSSVTIVVGVSSMAFTGGPLALIYLAGAVPMLVLTFRFRGQYARAARRARDQAGDLATTVEESVHGIRVLKAFGRGQEALDDFIRQADELRETEIEKAATQAHVTVALTAIPEMIMAVSLGAGVWMAGTGRLSVGALVAYFATAAIINRPVEQLGNLLAVTLDARAATDRIMELMNTRPSLVDPDDPVAIPAAGPEGTTVEFRDVEFRYPGASEPLLDHLDLVLAPGRTTALVGLTGTGKSTLLNLVPRLYEVTGGAILIEGVDVRDATRHDVRGAVSIAFEDPILFSASVRDNVLVGIHPDAEDPAELVRVALDVAQAGFVYDLPLGLDTIIGEEGMSLSGGQRQRVALARAIAGHPRVLVMDDPLSALDVVTEAAVTTALRQMLPGTTTLIVAHRPSTVSLADEVAVLQDGRITGFGTHADLLATHDHYRFVLTALEAEADLAADRLDPLHDPELRESVPRTATPSPAARRRGGRR